MSDRTRAQSEVLGFVFVFSIITLTAAVVYAGGFASVQDARDAERVDNAARSFEVLADNFDDVVQGAPSRGTELKLSDATLTVGEETTFNVTGQNVSDPTDTFSGERTVRPIAYESDGTRIVYVSGLVVREDPSGSVVLREPRFVAGPDRVSLPIAQTRSREIQSVGGTNTVLVRAERSHADLLAAETGSGTYQLTLTITSPRANLWYRALDDHPAVSCTMVAADEVACDTTSERVYVTAVAMDVSLEH